MENTQPNPDDWLIHAFLQDDPGPQAVEQVLKRVKAYVWTNHAHFRRDADDIAAETVWRVSKKIKTLNGKFSSWVCGIANKVVLEYSAKQPASINAPLPECIPPASLEDPQDLAVNRYFLEESIQKLPISQAEVIQKHDLEGYTLAEVGNLMRTNENTAKKARYRALANLRDIMVDEGLLPQPSTHGVPKHSGSRRGTT